MHRTRYHKRKTKTLLVPVNRLRSEKLFFALLLMSMLGVIYGVLLSKQNAAALSPLSFLTEGFVAARCSGGFFALFFRSFSTAALLLFATFWLGLSAVSQPIIFLLPLFRGLGIGISMGYLTSQYKAQGIAFGAVLLLPYAILSTFLLLLSCREAIRLSNLLLTGIWRSERLGVPDLRLYCLKGGVLFLLLIPAALLDATLSFLFARFFTLTP